MKYFTFPPCTGEPAPLAGIICDARTKKDVLRCSVGISGCTFNVHAANANAGADAAKWMRFGNGYLRGAAAAHNAK